MVWLTAFFIIFCPASLFATQSGISVFGGFGYPSLKIENPDGTTAGYDGLAFQGGVQTALFGSPQSQLNLFLSYTLHDLENTQTQSSGREFAKHRGMGLGLLYEFGSLYLGYELGFIEAEHFYVGQTGIESNFDYQKNSGFLGLRVPVGTVDFNFVYEVGTGKISNSETGFASDSSLESQTFWLTVSFNSKTSVGKLTKGLIK